MKKLQVSQKIIAEEVGVSIMTVSKVLRGKEDVAESTRERVLEVAKKHRYRPNLLVRGMKTGKTNTIGVMLPPWPFYDTISSGLHDELIQADHVPLTIWSAFDACDKTIDGDELTQIHRLLDRRVDGVILKPIDEAVSDDYLREVWERGIPLVVLDRELPKTHADFVGTNDVEGGRLAAEYLLGLGHRRLACLVPGASTSTYAVRQKSFVETVAGVHGAEATVCTCRQDDEEMYEAALGILSAEHRPTALFATTDHAAALVYRAARKRAVRIPEDLSVVGFGNLDLSAYLAPSLTTFEQFPYRIGREAAKLVLERSHGKRTDSTPVSIRIAPELVTRESVAPFRKG